MACYDNLTIKERLFLYINYTGLSFKSFAYNCGLSEATLNKLDKNTSRTTFSKIYAAFPYLNPSWLLLAEGEMLREHVGRNCGETKDDSAVHEYSALKEQIQSYITLLAQKDEQISRLLAMVEEKDKMIAKLVEKL